MESGDCFCHLKSKFVGGCLRKGTVSQKSDEKPSKLAFLSTQLFGFLIFWFLDTLFGCFGHFYGRCVSGES